MTPGELASAVAAVVREAVDDGEFAMPVPGHVALRATATGDFVTPVALRLAGAAGRSAAEIAGLLAERLIRHDGIAGATVTGPGFLTIEMDIPLSERICGSYGLVPGLPAGAWPRYPLTFDNPGFRVRFAYARACRVERHAAEMGIRAADGPLEDRRERLLVGLLADVPGRAEHAARRGDSRPFMRHLELTAGAYHDVHEQCPALPKGDEPVVARHAVRVGLARAVRVAVGNALRALGETPDERL